MSTCAALVYIEKDGLFVFFIFPLKFGLSGEVRAKEDIAYEKKPHIVLIV